MGGVAEAHSARGDVEAAVIMLAPGSGLGCAYVDREGLPLDGDTISGMEAAHMPAPCTARHQGRIPADADGRGGA
jgi:glucokinase